MKDAGIDEGGPMVIDIRLESHVHAIQGGHSITKSGNRGIAGEADGDGFIRQSIVIVTHVKINTLETEPVIAQHAESHFVIGTFHRQEGGKIRLGVIEVATRGVLIGDGIVGVGGQPGNRSIGDAE